MFNKKIRIKGVLFTFLVMALLAGCGSNASAPKEDASEEVTEEVPAAQSDAEAPTAQSDAETKEETAAAESGKIYEGLYFDESFYRYIDMPAEESPLIYCEITISNVTDTSFDFTINKRVMATDETSVLVPSGTASIEEAGSKAVYEGENLTLTFSFPDDENTFPQHLEVTGLEELENKVYINNSIPGHESG